MVCICLCDALESKKVTIFRTGKWEFVDGNDVLYGKFGSEITNITKMKISHIEHIGIAVKSIDEAIPFYEDVLGLKCYAVEEVKDQKVKTAFFKVGETKIELLESTDPEGPIGKFIEKKGEGMHHLAFAVDDLAGALPEVEGKGIRLIDKTPRKGAEGLNIGFLHPKSTFGVLTELCEDPSS
jgi:methylmalonyl-CoA/ethylmalonyl-CoA epimerase